MIPELIIHRVGGFAVLTPSLKYEFELVGQKEIYNLGKKIGNFVTSESPAYRKATEAVSDVLNGWSDSVSSVDPATSDTRGTEVDADFSSSLSIPGRSQYATVARLPALNYQIENGPLVLRLKARFSLTTCIFERPNGRTKIWTSVEAFPLKGSTSWKGGAQAVIGLMDRIADAALPNLALAVGEGANHVLLGKDLSATNENPIALGNERIRVTMVDDFDPTVGALLDAVEFRDRTPLSFDDPVDPLDRKPSRGLHRLIEFVNAVDREAGISEHTLHTILPDLDKLPEVQRLDLDRIATIFNQRSIFDDQHNPVGVRAVGVARRRGRSNLRNVPTNNPKLAEQLLHLLSGARSGSAYLAGRLSEGFESKVFQQHGP